MPPLTPSASPSLDASAPRLDRVGVFSPGLMRVPGLKTFLGVRDIVLCPPGRGAGQLDAVVGWGRRHSAERARAFAVRHGLRYYSLEHGFLRASRLRPEQPPVSLVVDDIGVHYDARSPSRLEMLLASAGEGDLPSRHSARARALRTRLQNARLQRSERRADGLRSDWRRGERPLVMVVDQTRDDPSVQQGDAAPRAFRRMVEAACDEHPNARIVVASHPAKHAAREPGYLESGVLPPGVERSNASGAMSLLQHADHVYVCSAPLGFDALMMDKPVRCFGLPFYAGWGLTDDDARLARRSRKRSIDDLVAAALLLYPRYVHPVRGERCEPEDIIEHLALQRRIESDNQRRFHCVGFSTWKRPFVRRYLATADGSTANVHFVRSARALEARPLDSGDTVVLWGARPRAPRLRTRAGADVPVWRMEDGFLRSVQLGSERTPPGSLVLDRRGLYYDPSVPSDLEHILMTAEFSPDELARAERLRRRIVELRVSKYNLSARDQYRPHNPASKSVVLVIGQVDDDASVELANSAAKSNAELVCSVRANRPDAHLVYKPHPDVLAGNRRGIVTDARVWDELVEDATLDACLAVADEVHTISSLVGFEALLRGIAVTTYGQPFYSGWGLTHDRAPLARRTRRLTLDELVAGTLLRYPRYLSPRANAFCTPEQMITELAQARANPPRWSLPNFWLRRRVEDLVILATDRLRARGESGFTST